MIFTRRAFGCELRFSSSSSLTFTLRVLFIFRCIFFFPSVWLMRQRCGDSSTYNNCVIHFALCCMMVINVGLIAALTILYNLSLQRIGVSSLNTQLSPFWLSEQGTSQGCGSVMVVSKRHLWWVSNENTVSHSNSCDSSFKLRHLNLKNNCCLFPNKFFLWSLLILPHHSIHPTLVPDNIHSKARGCHTR